MTALTTRDERFAALAATLSRAAGVGDVAVTDAGRVIRHELRRRNTSASLRATRRSKRAQAVIEHYGVEGKQIPKNGSLDALHCDHVYAEILQIVWGGTSGSVVAQAGRIGGIDLIQSPLAEGCQRGLSPSRVTASIVSASSCRPSSLGIATMLRFS